MQQIFAILLAVMGNYGLPLFELHTIIVAAIPKEEENAI
jgi:hypothetical protein